jgi:hypothetical protein
MLDPVHALSHLTRLKAADLSNLIHDPTDPAGVPHAVRYQPDLRPIPRGKQDLPQEMRAGLP